jgi:hypothetical protein
VGEETEEGMTEARSKLLPWLAECQGFAGGRDMMEFFTLHGWGCRKVGKWLGVSPVTVIMWKRAMGLPKCRAGRKAG